MQRLSGQPYGPPETGVPGQIVPAATHSSTAAQLWRGQVGEDLQENWVWEEVNESSVVGLGWTFAALHSWRGMHYSNSFTWNSGGQGRRFVSIWDSLGCKQGRTWTEDESRTGRAERPHAEVRVCSVNRRDK